jgi:hypothetical protein
MPWPLPLPQMQQQRQSPLPLSRPLPPVLAQPVMYSAHSSGAVCATINPAALNSGKLNLLSSCRPTPSAITTSCLPPFLMAFCAHAHIVPSYVLVHTLYLCALALSSASLCSPLLLSPSCEPPKLTFAPVNASPRPLKRSQLPLPYDTSQLAGDDGMWWQILCSLALRNGAPLSTRVLKREGRQEKGACILHEFLWNDTTLSQSSACGTLGDYGS